MLTSAFYKNEWGWFEIGQEEETVTCLQKVEKPGDLSTPNAFSDGVFQELNEYLAGKRQTFSFAVRPAGTEFQQRVWAALREIPYGETRSYQDIARRLGKPNACRAVGGAVHRNPILFVIPCHRVIGANGSLTGYSGGLALKEALLKLEKKMSEKK